MTNKQLVHAYIEPHVYAKLKSIDINISGTVNNLLKNYLVATEPDGDIQEVENKIKSLYSQVEELQDEIRKESAVLVALKEKSVREKAEEDERMALLYRAARHNNPLRDVL